MPSILTADSRIARSTGVLIIGESIGVQYNETGGAAAMVTEIRSRAALNSVFVLNQSASGRYSDLSICNADAGASCAADSYWWDSATTDGSALYDEMIALVALAPQPFGSVVISQNVNDSGALAGTVAGITAAAAWTNRRAALMQMIAAIRAATGLATLPVFLDMPLRSGGSRSRGYERARQNNFHVIRSMSNVFAGAAGYDAGTRDGTHFTAEWATEIGRRVGHRIAANAHGASGCYLGPSVASVTKVSNTLVDVAITLESGDTLNKPGLPPLHWRIESDTAYGTAVPISAISWVGTGTNTARLTLSSACTGAPVFYPCYDGCETLDWSRHVFGTVSRMPVRDRDLGWTGPL